MKKYLVYIADFFLPNMSAYTLHVLKYAMHFQLNHSVKLIIPYKSKI